MYAMVQDLNWLRLSREHEKEAGQTQRPGEPSYLRAGKRGSGHIKDVVE